jgi:DNA polymerase-1
LAGRKRFFMLASTDKAQRATTERSIRNHPIQGTNADILKRALALLYTALPERVHLLLCVHDEIVLECPEDLLEGAERILKEAMVQACRDFLKVVCLFLSRRLSWAGPGSRREKPSLSPKHLFS